MNQNQQQINKIMKNFYFYLLEYSGKGIQGVYSNLKPQIFSYGKIRDVLNQYGLSTTQDIIYDTQYAFLPIETVEPMVWDVMTLLHKFAYKSELFDCDQFAHLTTGLCGLLYGINTCGSAYGTIYDAQTGAKITAHYFNILITYSGEPYRKFELWLCDALNPVEIVKIERGRPIIAGSWLYKDIQNAKFF